MAEPAFEKRNTFGLFLITFVLGPGALFLWLGRAKLALLYAVLAIGAAVVWFILASMGVVSLRFFAGVDVSTAAAPPILAVGLCGFLHALRINREPISRPWYSRWYVALPSFAFVSLAAAFIVRTFFFHPFNVPSSSNEPNLMTGDYFFASKTAYASGDPQRGDMAVFKSPADPDVDFVKRVIGLSGDRVQMKNGLLVLNGTLVPRERLSLPESYQGEQSTVFFRETLPGGRSYAVGEFSDDGPGDNTDEYIVPEGHYFVMGDSRDNSMDSRYLNQMGFIPRANFVGPAVLRFWNTQGHELADRPPGAFANE